jgi:hypothetical protein
MGLPTSVSGAERTGSKKESTEVPSSKAGEMTVGTVAAQSWIAAQSVERSEATPQDAPDECVGFCTVAPGISQPCSACLAIWTQTAVPTKGRSWRSRSTTKSTRFMPN